MAPEVAPLTPMSLGTLLSRIAHEWEHTNRIFDLPTGRFHDVSDGPDLRVDFMGRPAATPIGPAAGPHSQLAENIVLSWLGGSRIFELKTVQVIDDLDIGRPCIDMETVGYNIEWSQELRVDQSLTEYVKAWMIIEILSGWDELVPHIGEDPGPHVFDLSVGYDLAGISSPKVSGFIDGLRDATATIDRLRAEIPDAFGAWRDHPFPTHIADTVTLSTFHGCPPDEIESITKHLMTRHDLDVVVKLNPTLLGFDRVHGIVRGTLGYEEVRLRRPDFEADLQFDRAIGLIGELDRFAAEHGRRFGIKLTNTLVVENHRRVMPDDTMYLSGPPLHVLAVTLLDELHRALPGLLRVDGEAGSVQVSFSAGITKDNLPDAAGLGLTPITVCSDLLKPGGYGRLSPMLGALGRAMDDAGVVDLAAWRRHAGAQARAGGFNGPVAAYASLLHDPDANAAYSREGTAKLPRSVDHDLEMWGCVACNFCVTVCPNDAFFKVPTPEGFDADGRQQYLVLVELCNECGNCVTFCPEVGDPSVVKPRLYTDPQRFADRERPGFLVGGDDGRLTVTAAPGMEGDVDRVHRILATPEGLPLDVNTTGEVALTGFTIAMPWWFDEMSSTVQPRATDEERMAVVLAFARRNVTEGTGGPFAAGIFESDTGRLVTAGVNVVVPSNAAIAHAEATAVALAGQQLATFDLGAPGLPRMELVCSTAPCVMCLGVTIWSGVGRLVCGARASDAKAIGFDEGPRPDDWLDELRVRDIDVVRDVLRDDAAAVLREYAERGGPIYNGGAARA